MITTTMWAATWPRTAGIGMSSWLLNALLAGLAIAVVAGPLGSFVVWRRMAYFGDALAHASLLGIGLGLILGLPSGLTVVIVAALVALLLVALQGQRQLASDTLLGIISHGTLSIGVIMVTLVSEQSLPIESYLFGDILSVTEQDVLRLWALSIAALVLITIIWKPLLAATVHEDLARVEGVPVERVRLIFVMLLALMIAMAMKIVGVLLIASLLLIPAAAARRVARTPEQMAVLAAGLSCVAVLLGLGAALRWDLPAGPAVVAAAVMLFVLLFALTSRIMNTNKSY